MAIVELNLSPNISDFSEDGTTAQLTPPSQKTTGDFLAGRISDDANPIELPGISLEAENYTELEFSVLISALATAGDEIEFRVTDSGAVLDNYLQAPAMGGSSLSPINITTGAFVVSFPEIGQKHGLQVAGIEAQSPFVQAPVFGIQAGTDDLISTDLATPLPLVDSPTLRQNHALGTNSIETNPVVINSPFFNRVLSNVIVQRSFKIAYENREYSVEYKNRAYAIGYENREDAVEYENRTSAIEYENRTLTA